MSFAKQYFNGIAHRNCVTNYSFGLNKKLSGVQVVVHPSYEYPLNDIALIKLQRAVQKSHFVHPICLPNGEKPVKGTSCFLSGYESECG